MKTVIKRSLLTTVKVMTIMLVAAFVGVFLLCAVYTIPTSAIKSNVKASCEFLVTSESEIGWGVSLFDEHVFFINYSDSSMMIDEALFDNPFKTSILQKSLNNYAFSINGCNAWTVEGLNELVNFNDDSIFDWIGRYGRYWHGYLIFLKPFLVIFNLQQIYLLNLILFGVLIFTICILMYKKCKKLIIPYIISLMFLSPFINAMCLQYCPVFYTFNIGMLLVLLLYERLNQRQTFIYLFLGLGMATSFFDVNTYQLATLFMPLIVVLFMKQNELTTRRASLVFFIRLCASWAIGYGGFWLMKWTIGTIFTDTNYFQDGIDRMFFRLNSKYDGRVLPDNFHLKAIIKNINMFFNQYMKLKMFVFLFIIYSLCKNKYFSYKNGNLYILMILINYLWYFVAGNFAYMCASFTNKSQVAVVFALLTWFVSGIKQRDTVNDKNAIVQTKQQTTWRELLKFDTLSFYTFIMMIILMASYVAYWPVLYARVYKQAEPIVFHVLTGVLICLAVVIEIIGLIRYYQKQKNHNI